MSGNDRKAKEGAAEVGACSPRTETRNGFVLEFFPSPLVRGAARQIRIRRRPATQSGNSMTRRPRRSVAGRPTHTSDSLQGVSGVIRSRLSRRHPRQDKALATASAAHLQHRYGDGPVIREGVPHPGRRASLRPRGYLNSLKPALRPRDT